MTSVTCIAKVTTCILLLGCATTQITASAIPMWEFLSRDEKVSSSGYERESFGFFQLIRVNRYTREGSVVSFSGLLLGKKTIGANLCRRERSVAVLVEGKMRVGSVAMLLDRDRALNCA